MKLPITRRQSGEHPQLFQRFQGSLLLRFGARLPQLEAQLTDTDEMLNQVCKLCSPMCFIDFVCFSFCNFQLTIIDLEPHAVSGLLIEPFNRARSAPYRFKSHRWNARTAAASTFSTALDATNSSDCGRRRSSCFFHLKTIVSESDIWTAAVSSTHCQSEISERHSIAMFV